MIPASGAFIFSISWRIKRQETVLCEVKAYSQRWEDSDTEKGSHTAWGIPASKRVWIFIEFISYSSPSSVDLNVTMYLVSAAVQTLRNTWIAYCWINTGKQTSSAFYETGVKDQHYLREKRLCFGEIETFNVMEGQKPTTPQNQGYFIGPFLTLGLTASFTHSLFSLIEQK